VGGGPVGPIEGHERGHGVVPEGPLVGKGGWAVLLQVGLEGGRGGCGVRAGGCGASHEGRGCLSM